MLNAVATSKKFSQIPIDFSPIGTGRYVNFINFILSVWISAKFEINAKKKINGSARPNITSNENCNKISK